MPILRFGSTGAYVEWLQSTLKKLGFYNGNVDGIFGSETLNAVKTFQKEFGLSADGIVGKLTWNALMPYLNGKLFDIVPTDIIYPYSIMMKNIRALQNKYRFLEISYYGNSILGKSLPVIKLGKGPRKVFYSASIHGNEWINSVVFMKFIEDYAKAYMANTDILGTQVRELFDKVTIYVAPMTNPDGVDLVLWQLPTNSPAYINARSIANNFPNLSFPNDWKANIVGVDLNLQFPANWEKAREIKYSQGFNRPAPRDFVGYGPLTEPESIGIYNFTLANNFNLILSYHTQGEIIFWKYLNYEPEEAEKIANEFSKYSGYELINEADTNSYAGYRDWFIQTYRRPGYTIETGKGTNPLPISQFNQIYDDNLKILLLAGTL